MKRTPRSLRIQKAPTLERNSKKFCTKSCEILNKASLDLMVLVIVYTQDDTQRLLTEIQEQICCSKDDATCKSIEDELKNDISKYQEKWRRSVNSRETLLTTKTIKFILFPVSENMGDSVNILR